MDILNDLTKCNFYYYILSSNKAYRIFKYLQFVDLRSTEQSHQVALTKNNICIEDAFIRRQPIKVGNNVVRYLNTDLKAQYQALKDINQSKLDKHIDYIKLGYLLVTQYLVNKGIYITTYNDYVNDLSLAAENGHLEIVKYLINSSIELSSRRDDLVNNSVNIFFNEHDEVDIHADNDEALSFAIENGHLTIVQYLVANGANIYADANSFLSYAAENGHLDIVQYLVSIGANINANNDHALNLAAISGHLEVIKYLVNINIDSADQGPALLNLMIEPADPRSALVNRKYDRVDIHVDNPHLLWAINGNRLPVIKYLISIGANIYAENNRALNMAAINSNLEIVHYLISVGANTDSLTAAQKLQFNIN